MEMKNGEETLPAVWVSAIPLAVLASLLFLVIRCFGGEIGRAHV